MHPSNAAPRPAMAYYANGWPVCGWPVFPPVLGAQTPARALGAHAAPVACVLASLALMLVLTLVMSIAGTVAALSVMDRAHDGTAPSASAPVASLE